MRSGEGTVSLVRNHHTTSQSHRAASPPSSEGAVLLPLILPALAASGPGFWLF